MNDSQVIVSICFLLKNAKTNGAKWFSWVDMAKRGDEQAGRAG